MNDLFADLPRWVALADDALPNWRQIGLIAALALACGLLFWRLGKRSRAPSLEAELLLEDEAAPEDFEAVLREAGSARSLEPRPARKSEVLLLKDPAPAVEHHFVTLRDAIVAMKAEQARLSATRNSLHV